MCLDVAALSLFDSSLGEKERDAWYYQAFIIFSKYYRDQEKP